MKNFMYAVAAVAVLASGSSFVLADSHGHGDKAGKYAKKMEKKLDKRFDEQDLDKDGSVSKVEFLTAAEKKLASIDADGNGAISKDEMKAHMKEKREKMKEKRDKMKDKKKEAQE